MSDNLDKDSYLNENEVEQLGGFISHLEVISLEVYSLELGLSKAKNSDQKSTYGRIYSNETQDYVDLDLQASKKEDRYKEIEKLIKEREDIINYYLEENIQLLIDCLRKNEMDTFDILLSSERKSNILTGDEIIKYTCALTSVIRFLERTNYIDELEMIIMEINRTSERFNF